MVSLAIIRQPIVRVLPIKYPASEIYFFRPLANEVPVYQKPFTLVQEVILEGTQKPKQHSVEQRIYLTLACKLEYQACDEITCYYPVSIRLSWMLTLRPLVTERPDRAQ